MLSPYSHSAVTVIGLRTKEKLAFIHIDGCVNPGITEMHVLLLIHSPEHLFIQWLQESSLPRRKHYYSDLLLMLHTGQ
ncbi:hypothetical protein RvY_03843 [Ramazzottius varieornatus]|uniref:Uncharacterized protein n=1 Tax=Ramazzottius varieornatus TaxID=947166 RepID=A0A1D1USX2_RAMVA|nr:hypothetical protein RvY_03843 [Ramazzottius varieornatus]